MNIFNRYAILHVHKIGGWKDSYSNIMQYYCNLKWRLTHFFSVWIYFIEYIKYIEYILNIINFSDGKAEFSADIIPVLSAKCFSRKYSNILLLYYYQCWNI